MSRLAVLNPSLSHAPAHAAAYRFAAAALGPMRLSALLAGWAPLGFSIATVFLFAGPHNWAEARYFLTRLPARWGKLRGFCLFGSGGVVGLWGCFQADYPLTRDAVEHWAAGVEAYFDAAGDGPAPLLADRPIATCEAVRAYDPGLHELVDETMAYRRHVDWRARPVRQAAGPR
jgi:hypothetical protein